MSREIEDRIAEAMGRAERAIKAPADGADAIWNTVARRNRRRRTAVGLAGLLLVAGGTAGVMQRYFAEREQTRAVATDVVGTPVTEPTLDATAAERDVTTNTEGDSPTPTAVSAPSAPLDGSDDACVSGEVRIDGACVVFNINPPPLTPTPGPTSTGADAVPGGGVTAATTATAVTQTATNPVSPQSSPSVTATPGGPTIALTGPPTAAAGSPTPVPPGSTVSPGATTIPAPGAIVIVVVPATPTPGSIISTAPTVPTEPTVRPATPVPTATTGPGVVVAPVATTTVSPPKATTVSVPTDVTTPVPTTGPSVVPQELPPPIGQAVAVSLAWGDGTSIGGWSGGIGDVGASGVLTSGSYPFHIAISGGAQRPAINFVSPGADIVVGDAPVSVSVVISNPVAVDVAVVDDLGNPVSGVNVEIAGTPNAAVISGVPVAAFSGQANMWRSGAVTDGNGAVRLWALPTGGRIRVSPGFADAVVVDWNGGSAQRVVVAGHP